jgi:carbonic anhydrase
VTESPESTAFDDLLEANARFAETFSLAGYQGVARAGVAMVTCMDSRIDPLSMVGLLPGDAKVLRNPGGRVTDQALGGLVLAVNLLDVHRIMVVQHTRCAMASASEAELRERVSASSGSDASSMTFGAIEDQRSQIIDDVERLRGHSLVPAQVAVGGFLYDVDTGLLDRLV